MNVINQLSNLWRLTLAVCAVLFVFATTTPRAIAQCDRVWQPFDPTTDGITGLSYLSRAVILWDRDGTGPIPPKIVVSGDFSHAGEVYGPWLAAYDLETDSWSRLGTVEEVNAFAVLPNGDLIAGGSFVRADGVVVNRIARWNGEAWSSLGTGLNGVVYALTVLPNGDLIAAGDFTTAGGVSASRIARWNGSTWSPLGNGVNGVVLTIARLANGDVIAGGIFSSAGGLPASRIARWDGTGWSSLGTGMSSNVRAIGVFPNGNVLAAGDFSTAGGVTVNYVARWDGTTWSSFGTGCSAPVRAVSVISNDEFYVGGSFVQSGGVVTNYIAKWTNDTWHSLDDGFSTTGLGGGAPSIRSIIALPNGDIVVAGQVAFSHREVYVANLPRWNGSTWLPLNDSGIDDLVKSVRVMSNGDIVIGGRFSRIGDVDANSVARWNGTNWSSLGSGHVGTNLYPVRSFGEMPDGRLIAAGAFSDMGGVAANNIAVWDGSVWSPLGVGVSGYVQSVAVLSNGDVVAGGLFSAAGGVSASNIARWNGSTWVPLGSGMNDEVSSIIVLPNDIVIAGGRFTSAGGVGANRIARWDGTSWSPLGLGLNGAVNQLAVHSNGDVLACGSFSTAGGVSTSNAARWNGSSWSSMSASLTGASGPLVYSIAGLPNGNVVMGGSFERIGGANSRNIGLWNGTSWGQMGSGLSSWVTNPFVAAVTALPNGDVIAVGNFLTTNQNSMILTHIARWATPVPPTITGQPQSQSITAGQTLVLTASPAAGSAAVSIQWKRNGINIRNGLGGASPGGGTVVGASGSMGSITNGTPASLYISNFQPSDAGSYTATFSNSCGSITSLPATITITPPPCAADFNADTVLDFFDYLDFVSAFAANQPAADFNADTVIDFFDYLDFVAEFANGC